MRSSPAAVRGLAAIFLLLGCAPRARPLAGTLAPSTRVPRGALDSLPTRLVFKWQYSEGEMGARGEGVARLAPPDSVRLDLFLAGGMGNAGAILLGERLVLPDGGDMARRFIPPPPLLWAALGRLAVPPSADTIVRVDADTVRADIGRAPVWRVTFVGVRLARLERIEDGRVVQWTSRDANGRVRYEDERANRILLLTVERRETVLGFDPQIWHF